MIALKWGCEGLLESTLRVLRRRGKVDSQRDARTAWEQREGRRRHSKRHCCLGPLSCDHLIFVEQSKPILICQLGSWTLSWRGLRLYLWGLLMSWGGNLLWSGIVSMFGARFLRNEKRNVYENYQRKEKDKESEVKVWTDLPTVRDALAETIDVISRLPLKRHRINWLREALWRAWVMFSVNNTGVESPLSWVFSLALVKASPSWRAQRLPQLQ